MKPFYLKSITIYEQCDEALMKTLKPGKYKLSERLPFDMYGENISICAIVGENGAGKSSLLDILYRIINNFSYLVIGNASSRNAADVLYYITGLYASVEYVLNGKDCQMDIAKDLGYVSSDKLEEVSRQISQVAALLSGMRRKILGENSLIH